MSSKAHLLAKNERHSSNSSSSPSQVNQPHNNVYKNVRNLSNLYNYQFDTQMFIGGQQAASSAIYRLGVKPVDLAN